MLATHGLATQNSLKASRTISHNSTYLFVSWASKRGLGYSLISILARHTQCQVAPPTSGRFHPKYTSTPSVNSVTTHPLWLTFCYKCFTSRILTLMQNSCNATRYKNHSHAMIYIGLSKTNLKLLILSNFSKFYSCYSCSLCNLKVTSDSVHSIQKGITVLCLITYNCTTITVYLQKVLHYKVN
jgi:hypothetical protein